MDRHQGVPLTLRQLTQMAFLVRLVALVLALAAGLGQALTGSVLLAVVIIGGTSFLGLMNTGRLETLVRRRPWVALADGLIVASAVAVTGVDSPIVLAALTTALLLGLWLEPGVGLVAVLALVALYLVGSTHLMLDGATIFIAIVVIPFVYVTLWLLGVTVRRASDAELRSQTVLRDAIATAAASEERAKVARELHDELAKTLQGLTLTAAALPPMIERQPAQATRLAEDLQSMGALAVGQVRGMMSGLRVRTSSLPLAELIDQIVSTWVAQTGRDVDRRIERLDTTDEAIRYELGEILQESLSNIARHAGPCRVEVSLTAEGEYILLRVRDHGKGVDDERATAAAAAGHHGVTGMRERMARLGGRFVWHSAPGAGTAIECRVHKEGLVER